MKSVAGSIALLALFGVAFMLLGVWMAEIIAVAAGFGFILVANILAALYDAAFDRL